MGSEIGIRKEKVRDQVVMMGDDPDYWVEVEKVIKKDSRLISNQVIENGEGILTKKTFFTVPGEKVSIF